MTSYQEETVRLTNTQLNKFKSAEELPHELLLTTRRTTKIRNAVASNMPRDIWLNKP